MNKDFLKIFKAKLNFFEIVVICLAVFIRIQNCSAVEKCPDLFSTNGKSNLPTMVEAVKSDSLNSPSLSIRIALEDFPDSSAAKTLESESRKMLSLLEEDFLFPDSILFKEASNGPEFNNGIIFTKFPFSDEFTVGKRTKSTQESLGINLHELTHQIFRETILGLYKNNPEVIWSFFLQYDFHGRDISLDLINGTKSMTQFKNMDDQKILEHFDTIQTMGTAYNELFADLVPVFFMRDPDAVFKSINFQDVENNGSEVERQFQLSHHLRRFLIDGNVNVKAEERAEPHSVFAESRIWIWKNIYEDYYLKRHPEIPLGKILIRILKTMVKSFAAVTNDFQSTENSQTSSELNKSLIHFLKVEFSERP